MEPHIGERVVALQVEETDRVAAPRAANPVDGHNIARAPVVDFLDPNHNLLVL